MKILLIASLLIAVGLVVNPIPPASYDLVILNGRVIDPESRTDSIRNLATTLGTNANSTFSYVGSSIKPPIDVPNQTLPR